MNHKLDLATIFEENDSKDARAIWLFFSDRLTSIFDVM